MKIGDEILISAKGEELPFLRHMGDDWIQSSRVSGKPFKIPLVIGSKCEQTPEEQGADSAIDVMTELRKILRVSRF